MTKLGKRGKGGAEKKIGDMEMNCLNTWNYTMDKKEGQQSEDETETEQLKEVGE